MSCAVLIGSVLAGCGFQPLYGSQPDMPVVEDMAGVEVAPIADRIGQIVRNQLTMGLARNGAAASSTHLLEVDLLESIEGFGFRSDESITRERVRLVAHYRLIDKASGDVVIEDTVRADNSIDVVQSDYATFVAEETASKRNADQVARTILLRLALFFRAAESESGAS